MTEVGVNLIAYFVLALLTLPQDISESLRAMKSKDIPKFATLKVSSKL